MKILIATGIFPPQIGGPATYSKLLKDKFPERGVVVSVVNFGDTLFLPKIVRHVVYFTKVLWSGRTADIIYAQDPVSVGLPALVAATILRKRFYLKVVGDYAWEQFQIENEKRKTKNENSNFENLEEFQNKTFDWKTSLLKKIERYVARRADKVIVPSEYLKRIILQWGVSRGRIVVIYNGFTPPRIIERKEELRKKLSFGEYTIISVGRLVPWKGFSALIEVMPHLLSRIPDAKLLIVGEGPDRAILKKRVRDLHLEQSVTLLGKLTQKNLFEHIKASDVFVLNTAYEGFSHQLLEVMALGTPIVTTPVGGNPEIINDRVQGILVPWNDHRALEEVCIMLHEHASLALDLARAAKEKVNEWSDERMLETLTRELVL